MGIKSKEAHGPAALEGADVLRAESFINIRRGGQQRHLPRVFEPQPRWAEIGGEGREAAVREHMLPDARRKLFFYYKGKALPLPGVRGDGPAAPWRGQQGPQRGGQALFRPDEDRRALFQQARRLRRGIVHPAARAEKRLQPEGGETALDLPQPRAQVLPLLVGEEDKLCLQAAGFQQTEGAQGQIRLRRPPFPQGVGTGSAAFHTDHVQRIGKSVDQIGIVVDDSDVVPLVRQDGGDGVADLAAAGNDDFHGRTPVRRNLRNLILYYTTAMPDCTVAK